ncbi:MAG: MCP four helix bundle domain-containing protein [Acidobacteriia bacterium]|nr:MCP four helix bundle domain-containing protein [Terriglobia bacterium]
MNDRDKDGMATAPVQPRDRLLGVFSRYPSALLLLLVFAVEVGVGMFVIRDVRMASLGAQQMYARSVLGLRQIGELQYQAQETRRSTLYALTTNDSNLQVEYADQSREADRRVTEGISAYLQQARMPNEIDVGRGLQRDWSAYLKVRDEVLASILEGSTKEAVEMDLSGGVPSFERVRQDLEEIKRLYDGQASEELARVSASSRRSVVQLVGVVCFTLIFATFSVWAIQKSRMLGTVQLAKLQMDFVASISHELRTPLAVIRSAAENIADGVVEGKDQLAKYGSVIRNQSRQMTELVNQILLFVSSRERKSRYILQPLEVSEIINSALESTSELAREAGFVVEQQVEPGLPHVMGDLAALSRCLQNLLGNAIKYGGQARWVRIRAFREKAVNLHHGEIGISVQDRGIGIDHPDLLHIFDPFYRSPVVRAAQIHGTGLGLPLARNIAEAMGGKLTVESRLGVGSTFTLHLPSVRETTRPVAASASGRNAVAKK